jgi:hypothetical protein
MTLTTLADVRELIGHLPAEHRARSTWRHVEVQLAEAARGALDTREVWAALRVVLAIEGIKCEPK